MNRFYTSIKQSKHLLSLGMNPDTADMVWIPLNWQLTEYYVEVKQDGINTPKNPIPCWSLGALLEVMPKTMKGIPEKAAYSLTLKENSYNAWKCNYMYFSFGELYEFPAQPTPLKATYEMVCWLLENGYIKKGE